MILRTVSFSLLVCAACGGPEAPSNVPATDVGDAQAAAAMNDPGPANVSTTVDTKDVPPKAPTASQGSQMGDAGRTANTPPAVRPPTTSASGNDAAVLNNPGVADNTKRADNTGLNDRDRHGALTPTDQGSSRSETSITAAIRRAVVADGSLSFGAKNVKIITVGTKVTLRGPVRSAQEKTTIEGYAKREQGVTQVDDQLEVKQ